MSEPTASEPNAAAPGVVPPEPTSSSIPTATGPSKPVLLGIVAMLAIAIVGIIVGIAVTVSKSPATGPPGGGTNPPPSPPPSPTSAPLEVSLCQIDGPCTPNNPAFVNAGFTPTAITAPLLNAYVWDTDPLMGLGGMNVGGPYFPDFGSIYAQRDGADHGVGPIDEQIFFDLGQRMANTLLQADPSLEGYLAVRYVYTAATAEQFVTVADLRNPYEAVPPTMLPMTSEAEFPGRVTTWFWPVSFFEGGTTCPDPATTCTPLPP